MKEKEEGEEGRRRMKAELGERGGEGEGG